MLARDWYYNERNRMGIEPAVASIYDSHDDADLRALAEIYARDRKAPVRTQSAGLLSFSYRPESYDLIVSEFTLHHLPDFWKAVAMARIFVALKPGAIFYLRDIVYTGMPD